MELVTDWIGVDAKSSIKTDEVILFEVCSLDSPGLLVALCDHAVDLFEFVGLHFLLGFKNRNLL